MERAGRTTSLCVPDANSLVDSRGKIHIVYQIRIRSGSYHRTVSKKYSEFRLFDRIWRLMYSTIDVKLPPKVWIGNKSDKVVADRKTGLTKYLNDLIVLETLATSLGKFLSVSIDVIDRIREEMKSLGPCCDKYGAGCYCIADDLDNIITHPSSDDDSFQVNNHNANRRLSVVVSAAPAAASAGSNSGLLDPGNPTPPQLRCVRRFEARTPGQLSLFVGEVVEEIKTANGWYYGRNGQGQEGYFPSDHVQKC